MKKITSFILSVLFIFSLFPWSVAAEDIGMQSDVFVLHVEFVQANVPIEPSQMRFNLFDENGEWLANICTDVTGTAPLDVVFHIPEYTLGKRFTVVPTTGVQYVNYDKRYYLNEEISVLTDYYHNAEGQEVRCDGAYITVCPMYSAEAQKQAEWFAHAENKIAWDGVGSRTPYMIWISKNNFKVTVLLHENNKWNAIKEFPCSIGAPGSPTVTGQFEYYQYQSRWQYNGYYVGPVMRFYGPYAIHSTLLNNNGTDRDGRVGKRISHGCVRMRPEAMQWLTYYIPFGTRVYVTND